MNKEAYITTIRRYSMNKEDYVTQLINSKVQADRYIEAEKGKLAVKSKKSVNYWEAYKDGVEHATKLARRLDEPEMTATQAWKIISEVYNQDEAYWEDVRTHYVNSLLEPEKVAIPNHVAHWIEYCKQRGIPLWEAYSRVKPNALTHAWFAEADKSELVARAWLDGYKVKERRYRLKEKLPPIIKGTPRYLNLEEASGSYRLDSKEEVNGFKTIFTTDELRVIPEEGFEREEVTDE